MTLRKSVTPVALSLVALFLLAGAAQAQVDPRIALVSRVYRDLAAVPEAGPAARVALGAQSRLVLQRYFTQGFVDLLVQEQQCADELHHSCQLDWDPLWDCKGCQAMTAQVTAVDDKDIVTVLVTPAGDGGGMPARLSFQLEMTDRGWRIDDIRSALHSLRDVLKKEL